MAPHSLPLTVAGAGMLWVGWFGFNAGSALAANGSAGMAMLATHLGASAGALAWMSSSGALRQASVLGIVTGMVAGLGTITPASGFVGPLGAVAHRRRRRRGVLLRHAVPQAQARDRRLARRFACARRRRRRRHAAHRRVRGGWPRRHRLHGADRPWARRSACRRSACWLPPRGARCVTWVILKVLDVMVGLRVTEEQETEGLDLALHGERGYSP